MNKLIEVLEVQTTTGNDTLMREYIAKEVATIPDAALFDDGVNLYITKGVGPYPCMIAHMDTVHRIEKNLTAVVLNGKITGMNAITMTQTGIGGDDKVGIYIALEMLKEHDNIKVFFASDEEIGCVGSSHADAAFFADVTIALQCDRRGNSDFITNASGVELSSKQFQSDVFPIITDYEYKFNNGMMTDVMELKQNNIDISMANISCGYYNPHCDNEYVDVADVHRTTLMVSEIIMKLGRTYYPHIAPVSVWKANDIAYAAYSKSAESRWWEDDNQRATRLGMLGQSDYCTDCFQNHTSHASGLCSDCLSWYRRDMSDRVVDNITPTKKPFDFSKKMDYGQTPVKLVPGLPPTKKKKKGKWKGGW